MIPLMLDLAGRTVLIFGGGDVGVRKAAFFQHEAKVTVISRSFSPAFDGLTIRRCRMEIADLREDELVRMLTGAFLVVTATSDPALNDRIGSLCRERGVLWNNAAGEQGDVLVPSIVAGKHYLLAVTTFGMSPAVPRYLRLRLEREYAELDGMIALQRDLRAMLKDAEPVQDRRSATLWSVLCDEDIWAALASDYNRALHLAEERYLACPR
ncbi:bifunctional precorrin-2 dehydrogenase/sirohydrochlorin ferrochelatase [Methanoculleus sp. FWC-SCC1]|uniref:precorrin-2 dehydrogenase n=1 Tax=Methanoculleus frigidifontis TaxID=2584085 RepID=A0ABT8M698_9EURY|nr:bifunctional precorrin-2 dehydrogenase/sirohydrochlorin ferrochelatase [Methanoculleus sp. FWC-SCC1]MDN7023457.1 bifunctional precorrin-2 dehydrogenase/sirohydrochlorin ferrochelatase [Methanoculleus sp. FWC-SCC1]